MGSWESYGKIVGGEAGVYTLWSLISFMSFCLMVELFIFLLIAYRETQYIRKYVNKKTWSCIALSLQTIFYIIHLYSREGYNILFAFALFFHMAGLLLIFDYFTEHIAVFFEMTIYYERFRYFIVWFFIVLTGLIIANTVT